MKTMRTSANSANQYRDTTFSKTIDRFIAFLLFLTPFAAYFSFINRHPLLGAGAIIFGVLAHYILRRRQGIRVKLFTLGKLFVLAILCLLAFGIYRHSYWSGFIGVFIAFNYAIMMVRKPKNAYLKKRKSGR